MGGTNKSLTRLGHIRVRRGNSSDVERLKRTLIQVAHLLFEEGGLEAITVRNMAARANVAAMTPYKYFANKAEILLYIKNDILRDLLEYIQLRLPECCTAKDRLHSALESYIRYWIENPQRYRLMYLPHAPNGKETNDIVANSLETERLRQFHITLTAEYAEECGLGPMSVIVATGFQHVGCVGFAHMLHFNFGLMPAQDIAIKAHVKLLVSSTTEILKQRYSEEEAANLSRLM